MTTLNEQLNEVIPEAMSLFRNNPQIKVVGIPPSRHGQLRYAIVKEASVGNLFQPSGVQALYRRMNQEHKGIPERVLSSLPIDTITEESLKVLESQETDECIVCREKYKVGDNRLFLPCFHCYHQDCITPWLLTDAVCPTCKHRVST